MRNEQQRNALDAVARSSAELMQGKGPKLSTEYKLMLLFGVRTVEELHAAIYKAFGRRPREEIEKNEYTRD